MTQMLNNALNCDFSVSAVKAVKERLANILKQQSIFRGNFVLASGQKSEYYLDTRLTTLSAEGAALTSYLIWAMIQPVIQDVQGVAGPSVGADPIVSGVCQFSYFVGNPIKGGYVRKENKVHGRGRLIEGPLEKNDNIIVLEDVITTGTSSLQAVNALREHGCNVEHLICLVLREERGKELLEVQGNLKVHCLFQASELL